MKEIKYKLAETKHTFTSRAGLLIVCDLIERLELEDLANRLMPPPGSNRGYSAGILFKTFMMMLHEGASCLDDVRELHQEKALMKLLGTRQDSERSYAGQCAASHGSKQVGETGFVGTQPKGGVGGVGAQQEGYFGH